MSTELTEKCVPSALPGGVITEERKAKVDALTFNAEQGEPLTLGSFVRVGFPQGANTEWIVPLSTGEVKLKELVGVACYYAKGGVLWGNKDPRPGSMPVLRTHNLVDAYQLNDDIGELSEAVLAKARREDGSYDWARLEYNRFGSAGKDRKGKRAKEFRSIFLLCRAWRCR